MFLQKLGQENSSQWGWNEGISPLGETIVRDVSKSLPNLKLCYSRVSLLPWPLEWHCADPKESANHRVNIISLLELQEQESLYLARENQA